MACTMKEQYVHVGVFFSMSQTSDPISATHAGHQLLATRMQGKKDRN